MNGKLLVASATLIALPAIAGAQSLQGQGVYIGLEGGASWMLNSTISDSVLGNIATSYPNLGFAAGAVVGYDFVGPRVELEAVFRSNTTTVRDANPGDGIDFSTQGTVNQWGVMANAYYDFNAGGTLVPYLGAGVGAAFLNGFAGGATSNATAFAYQGIVGVGYNVNEAIRINLDARYYGTTSPSMVDASDGSSVSFTNNNIAVMLGLQFKFGRAETAPPPPPVNGVVPPSFMVFFDWDRSNLSAQALNTIRQAAGQYKTKGSARVTATGHTDKSGPEAYNMALSLRRANTVKDALVREGVPPTAIAVIGRGETQPLVQTADGVREPQNRRVEIVIQ
ncbi:MAG: OmpA family protein [Alphaproteobacteria bacterium]|nr:OmpA family protein [Alphaproteobacteria bacterium]